MGYKDRARAALKQLKLGDAFKLQEGENFIRVLPTPESSEGADDDTLLEQYWHSDIGPEGRFLPCGHDARDRTAGSCYTCDVKNSEIAGCGSR